MSQVTCRKAFTLIELLIVVSIIALLIALLLPALAAARQTAQSVSCLANQRQIGIAVQVYANDSDEMLPVGVAQNWRGVTGDHGGWWTVLNPYLNGQGYSSLTIDAGNSPENVSKVFQCAAAPLAGGYLHYSSNPIAIWRHDESSWFPQLYFSRLTDATSLFLITDASQDTNSRRSETVAFMMDSGAAFWGRFSSTGISQTQRQLPWNFGLNRDGTTHPPKGDVRWRHPSNSLNLLFADGHAANHGQGTLIRDHIVPDGWRTKR